MTCSVFSGMQRWTGQQWVADSAVRVEGAIISALIPSADIPRHLPAQHYHFPADHFLVPGFIDLHIHGAEGKDVMDDSATAFHTIAQALAAEGVTGFLATTLSATNEKMASVLAKIPTAMQSKEGAALLGVHLEGPFIAPHKLGAHGAQYAQLPNMALIEAWQALAQGAIKVVTLAPELPGALAMIQALDQMGIVTSLGHTNASYAQMQAAIDAGGRQATHLFNAMRGIHQREPGSVSALLLSDEVMTELIADGIHLHPAIVDLTWRLKRSERVLLVTDAMRAKCLGDGQYTLGDQLVNVREGCAVLADGTLAGSVLRMPQAMQNMMQFTDCSFAEAINMASWNPACALKCQDRKGSIEVGKDADLVVMNAAFEVVLTMRGGKEVFKK